MIKPIQQHQDTWRKDFPITETHLAADGREIQFLITADESPTGFVIQAEETKASRGNRFGFTFRTFSPVSPYLALGDVRDKIRRRLATKYMERKGERPGLTHDELVGVIDYSQEEDEIVLQVDGEKITMDELRQIFSTYEGFEIALTIHEQ